MKTLYLAKVWPEPQSSAAGKRALDLLRAFRSRDWQVTLASAASRNEHTVVPDDLGIETASVQLNDSAFDHWLEQLQPELVLFDRYMTEEQFGWRVERVCPQTLRVLDTVDLHCLREARRQQVEQGGGLELFNEVALRELAAIHRSDLSLLVSDYECELLQGPFECKPTQLLYAPLVYERTTAAVPSFEEREHFVMIGNFQHPPNLDALHFCKEAIWPQLRQALPEAELHVYGAYESPAVRALEDLASGLRIRGRAEDAQQTLQRYRVNLAPLRYGAGIKGKIADGWCSGTPTVTTPIGAEGMQGQYDWGCPVSAKAEDFAEAALQAYSDSASWKAMQSEGYQILAERFNPAHWQGQLTQALEQAQNNREANRHTNLTGRLLRHHHQRSTEFMSRWIEAKNRG